MQRAPALLPPNPATPSPLAAARPDLLVCAPPRRTGIAATTPTLSCVLCCVVLCCVVLCCVVLCCAVLCCVVLCCAAQVALLLESQEEGVLVARLVEEGATVPVGWPIALLAERPEHVRPSMPTSGHLCCAPWHAIRAVPGVVPSRKARRARAP